MFKKIIKKFEEYGSLINSSSDPDKLENYINFNVMAFFVLGAAMALVVYNSILIELIIDIYSNL